MKDTIVFKINQPLNEDQLKLIYENAKAIGERIDAEPVVVPLGFDAHLERDITPLVELAGRAVRALERIADALEREQADRDDEDDNDVGYLNKR